MKEADVYFSKQEEPHRSCMLALRHLILAGGTFSEAWKYGMPMYCIDGKMVCYLWIHKKYKQPYLGIVDGNKIDDPSLLQEKRARMKILLLDPKKDLRVRKIKALMKRMVALAEERA